MPGLARGVEYLTRHLPGLSSSWIILTWVCGVFVLSVMFHSLNPVCLILYFTQHSLISNLHPFVYSLLFFVSLLLFSLQPRWILYSLVLSSMYTPGAHVILEKRWRGLCSRRSRDFDHWPCRPCQGCSLFVFSIIFLLWPDNRISLFVCFCFFFLTKQKTMTLDKTVGTVCKHEDIKTGQQDS